jgi:hypothetical protein
MKTLELPEYCQRTETEQMLIVFLPKPGLRHNLVNRRAVKPTDMLREVAETVATTPVTNSK